MVNPHEEGGDAPGGGGAPHQADVDGLVAAARQSDAALRRRRRRWQEQRRAEARSLDDVLLGAVGERVVVHLDGGATVAGVVEVVGHRVAQLDVTGRVGWVAIDAAVAVELGSVRPGDPADRVDTSLVDVLDDLAADRAEVRLGLRNGVHVAGTVTATGASVELRRSDTVGVVVLRLDAIASVTLLQSNLSR